MKKEIKKIIIKHVEGSKANQVEELSFENLEKITLGRDSSNQIQFDPELDSMVSRKHAVITWSDFENFSIEDISSTNGLYVNGSKLTQPTELTAGDTVQLGLHGPTFVFELNPRPESHMAATRLIPIHESKATEELVPSEIAGLENGPKESIGKQTFERAINLERRRSATTLVASLAGISLILSTLGFAFKDKLFPGKVIVNNNHTVSDFFDPAKIASENTNKVVFIEFGYKLINTTTGDDVYHRYMLQEDKKTKQVFEVPLYIEVNGAIEPFLGLKKDIEAGRPIAISQASGTGFVVDKNGFILTNRHVAAPWNTSYSFPPDAANGILLRFTEKGLEPSGTVKYPPMDWVPAESKFFGQKPISGKILEGQVTYMDVTFAKNDLRTPAKIVRVSNSHDVAMIKIDLPGELEAVTLKDNDAEIAAGQKVVVMGYPGISPDAIIAKSSDDVFNMNAQYIKVPDPTVTDCTIGKVIKGQSELSGTNTAGYYSTYGDVYQLTTSETGAGNSGGPVFDKNGNVIAIFTSGKWDGATAISFAVPISYGMELMKTQRVIQ
ncbi:MAG: FHA domain-containing protein [Saprospiraceae bacterium]|nr:FHA domain-containing protein [Saprospiraceae bacterium]